MKKRSLKTILGAVVSSGLILTGITAVAQSAANYPQEPVKFVVPYPAGGVSDVEPDHRCSAR